MEEYLKLITTNDAHWHPDFLKGECAKRALGNIPLMQFLATELMARTKERAELTKIFQASFVLLARAGNDAAAAEAFGYMKSCMMSTWHSSSVAQKLSFEEFMTKQREEEALLFAFIDTVFWELPLYEPGYWEERTQDAHGFMLGCKIPETKKVVIAEVARLWRGYHTPLAEQAFDFLLDCYDTHRFRRRAPQIAEAVDEYCKKNRYSSIGGNLTVPKKDSEYVTEAMKSNMSKDLQQIILWLRRAKEQMPGEWRLHRFFRHAYINVGGEISIE